MNTKDKLQKLQKFYLLTKEMYVILITEITDMEVKDLTQTRLNLIAGYRKMLGLTQEELSKKLGITAQAYGQKENGKVSFKDPEKVIILNILKEANASLTIQELFF